MIPYSSWHKLAQTYSNFIFDCDGVLYHGKEAIPGSFDALKHLQDLGKNVYLVTNATSRTREQCRDNLVKNHGYSGTPIENIYTAGYLTAQYLR